MNLVVLRGRLSSAPVRRDLASGSVLVSLEVTTDTVDGAVSAPVTWFDPPAPPQWEAGHEIVVVGVVKRRFFRTSTGTQSRTEVVANEVVDAAKRRQAERAVARAVDRLGRLDG